MKFALSINFSLKVFGEKIKNFFLRKSVQAGFDDWKIENGVLTRFINFSEMNFCTAKIILNEFDEENFS